MTLVVRTAVVVSAFLLWTPALGAETEQPSPDLLEIPPTTWPASGREACPSLRFCCVPGEAECVHPGLSRILLGGVGFAMFAAGAATFEITGDSLDAGDPQAPVMAAGLIALSGAGLGAIADVLTPGPVGRVRDRPRRPLARVSFSPGGSYTLGVQADPTLDLDQRWSVQPHLGFFTDLGSSEYVYPDAELRSQRILFSTGAELSLRLPYPMPVRRPLYTGAVELRYKPAWELRRRTLHPGEPNAQIVAHGALYPATFGLRWHASPRQRYTLYLGPRIDWISFSDPGDTALRHGGATLGRFYGEAWWQLDVPLVRSVGKTTALGRLNLGYLHSSLDNERFDAGAVVGYFGPVEISFDLLVRRASAPLGVQLTAGYRIATGGGAFFELGLAPRTGKGGE